MCVFYVAFLSCLVSGGINSSSVTPSKWVWMDEKKNLSMNNFIFLLHFIYLFNFCGLIFICQHSQWQLVGTNERSGSGHQGAPALLIIFNSGHLSLLEHKTPRGCGTCALSRSHKVPQTSLIWRWASTRVFWQKAAFGSFTSTGTVSGTRGAARSRLRWDEV